ncbi:MAG: caspase family protein [Gemmatimonadaceae bacterium]|nr:caspase family protein [Gemmatimonadaceae bacterium]MCW5827630.1 caspase family protein [Gemmatimonadaceae bacterium]
MHRPIARCLWLASFAVITSSTVAEAQTKRAVLVGINRYDAVSAPAGSQLAATATTRRITNLNGALNDATAMRDLLVGRFGFPAANARLMTDGEATRDAIIAAVNETLAQSQPGDVVVFFYAGHGSQRRNTLSPSPSRLDQTIVTADANIGAYDIRDKELGRLFNPFLDKGVELILIFDSCHSGSITRGGLSQAVERWAAIDERDAADPGMARDESPDRRGALVISAAQDYQSALERPDATGNPRGIFTVSLIETLNTVPPGESAVNVFRRLRARMQMDGVPQEPVLDATMQRQQRPVFGGASAGDGSTSVAVLRVSSGGVELQGGPALGIRPGAVLRKLSTGADSSIRVTVDSVLGISRTRGRVTTGSANRVQVGDLFVLERWVSAPSAGITLYVPPSGPDRATLEAVADSISELRGEDGIEWLDDLAQLPADSLPFFVMQWTGAGWELRQSGGAAIALPRRPTAAVLRERLLRAKGDAPAARFFLNLPPTAAVASQLRAAFPSGSSVVLGTELATATYALVGRIGGAGIQYALVQPTASQALAQTSPLPLRTDWTELGDGDASGLRELTDKAFTLARVRSWFLLEAPPGGASFPYRLAFRRLSDNALRTEGEFRAGETYEVELVADSAAVTNRIERRRIYVFAIDSHGNAGLVYPQGANVENRVPFDRGPDGRWPTNIPLGPQSQFGIGAPFGVDSFLLLASDEIIEPWAFEWSGVRSATRGAGSGPLSDLLGGTGTRTRGTVTQAPLSWSLDRVVIRTIDR